MDMFMESYQTAWYLFSSASGFISYAVFGLILGYSYIYHIVIHWREVLSEVYGLTTTGLTDPWTHPTGLTGLAQGMPGMLDYNTIKNVT